MQDKTGLLSVGVEVASNGFGEGIGCGEVIDGLITAGEVVGGFIGNGVEG